MCMLSNNFTTNPKLVPEDFQVIELQDYVSANKLVLYEVLGLCGPGEEPKLIDNGDTTYGGRWVVNPYWRLDFQRSSAGGDWIGAIRRTTLAAEGYCRQSDRSTM